MSNRIYFSESSFDNADDRWILCDEHHAELYVKYDLCSRLDGNATPFDCEICHPDSQSTSGRMKTASSEPA